MCANSESLPIKDNCADGMVANAILEHLPNEKMAIESITKILRAALMLAMPLSFRYIFPLLLPINLIHDRRIGHLRRYNREEILNNFQGLEKYDVLYGALLSKYSVSLCFYIQNILVERIRKM